MKLTAIAPENGWQRKTIVSFWGDVLECAIPSKIEWDLTNGPPKLRKLLLDTKV